MAPDIRVIVVSGLPGAGKSTIARALAARFPRAAHVEADRLQHMIVSGGRWPESHLDAESERQLRLRLHNVCQLAGSFARAGFVAVVDEICIGRRFDELRGEIEAPFHFVMLNPDLSTLAARNRGRAEREEKIDAFHQSRSLWDVVQRDTPRLGLWLDTSGMDAVTTVDTILSRIDDACISVR
jgi:adenylylsulfate kinase-like enzyme